MEYPSTEVGSDKEEWIEQALQSALKYGASPLIFSPSIGKQQALVSKELLKRVDASKPRFTPKWLHSYVVNTHLSRQADRTMRNYDSYSLRLDEGIDNLPESMYPMHERALFGFATPLELLALRDRLGMYSIELARLTHPYGEGVNDVLPRMREAVFDAIRNTGQELDDNPKRPKYRIRNSDVIMAPKRHFSPKLMERPASAVLVTRKRILTQLDDDTRIIERSSFILRLDTLDEVSSELAKSIQAIDVNEYNVDGWRKKVTAIIRQAEDNLGLLKDNRFDIAIPVETTIFAFNNTVLQKVIERERCRQDAGSRGRHIEGSDELALLKGIDGVRATELGQRALLAASNSLVITLTDSD